MHRIAVELPIVAIATAMMASLVLVAGSTIGPPTEPIVLAHASTEPRAENAARCLDAALTAPSTAETLGHARLCHDGQNLHLKVRVDGFAPGEVYSAWLGYAHQPAACQGSRCGPTDLPSNRPTALLQQVVGGAATVSRTLELDTTLRDVQLARGAQLSFLLLRPGGQAEPHAQAAFTIP